MTASQTPPRYLLPSEAAVLLQVNVKTVNRWSQEGRLPFIRTLGGHHRYPEAELRQLVEANTIPVTDPRYQP